MTQTLQDDVIKAVSEWTPAERRKFTTRLVDDLETHLRTYIGPKQERQDVRSRASPLRLSRGLDQSLRVTGKEGESGVEIQFVKDLDSPGELRILFGKIDEIAGNKDDAIIILTGETNPEMREKLENYIASRGYAVRVMEK